jgi:plasmid stabilization system protein ParE
MAKPEVALTVIVSPSATAELAEIWRWNADRYDQRHADEYVAFLRSALAQLPFIYKRGRQVTARPDLRYIVIRRKTPGHGHIAVYQHDDKVIHVLHLFHTAQDWPAKLE